MDIDRRNFSFDLLKSIEASLENAKFVSFDLEMSGISFNDPLQTPLATDSIPLRYAKSRLVAKEFGIIQFGLAIFRQ